MATNKLQFQAGLSMLEFFDLYGTQDKCEEVVRQWRWPQGFICPSCGRRDHSEFRRACRLYFQCSACRHQSSLISGTIFESSKLALPKWFVAMHLITQAKNGVSALELKRHVGVSWPTAWMMKHKILQVMFEREDSRRLTGRVEIDDAYLGGEHHLGSGTFHVGAFGLKAAINPGRDRSTGLTDHYSDVGLDASYILPTAKGDTFSVQARYVHESLNLAASCSLNEMPVGCAQTSLRELRGDIAYYWRGKLGLTLGAFSVNAPSNAFLYSGPLARPDSNGVTAQIDYTPWGAGNSPLGPRLNVRFGAQYIGYGQFNGSKYNFDGNGANASDNNVFRLFTWIAF